MVPKWRIEGDWIDSCSCNIGCPCNFEQDPTYGYCQGVIAFKIRKGFYGTTKLDGFSVAAVTKIPGNIFKGNWSLGMYIDSKADPKQREALEAIFSGRAGGLMAQFAPLVKEVKGIEYVPIDFVVSGKKWRLKIGKAVDIEGGPYMGKMTPKGKVTQILNAPMVETGPGEVLTTGVAKKSEVDAFGFQWDNVGRSSKYAPFHWRGP
jgi:hypothetical protein